MIGLLVFYIHIIAIVTAFTYEYQKEGIGAGALIVGFFVLIFSVGWSMSMFLLKLLIQEKGFGIVFNRDALSLLLLTVGEAVFYFFYYRGSKKQTMPTSGGN